MHIISKKFEFDYGHRVWNQSLDDRFSEGQKLVCRHLHGHRGGVEIFLASDELRGGMVTDFHHLNWFKKWCDDVIDHKFIIDIHDPLVGNFLPNVSTALGWIDKKSHRIVNTKSIKDSHLIEYYESFIVVDFVPTSENLARWIYDIVEPKMKKLRVKVQKVVFKETPKTQSTYEPFA